MVAQSIVKHFPDVLKDELFGVIDELFFFLVHYYGEDVLRVTEEIISKMNVSEEVEEAIFPQLVWWAMFCSPIGEGGTTIYQKYLQTNKHKWERKSKKAKEVLVSWLHLNPGFYYVDGTESESGSVFFLSDLFEGKLKLLYMYNETFKSPKRGEMLTGLLLPMGNGSYMTQGWLFHIPAHLTQKVVREIIPYFERHAISPSYKFNPQLYPSMLTRTLEAMNDNT